MTETYDSIAEQYDARYDNQECHNEDKTLFEELKPYATGSITDIGAGTGLLLDWLDVQPHNYNGSDPSIGMITQLHRKHPNHPISLAPYELTPPHNTKLTVSLNGSPSYIDPKCYGRLTAASQHLYMFYKLGYFPDFDDPASVKTDHHLVHNLFRYTYEYKQFTVATNLMIRLK